MSMRQADVLENPEAMITGLLGVLPYPKSWYMNLGGRQLRAIYRKYVTEDYVASGEEAGDDTTVNEWMNDTTMSQHSPPSAKEILDMQTERRLEHHNARRGHFILDTVNDCSLRFSFLTPANKIRKGIVSTYRTQGMRLGRGLSVPQGHLFVRWENGKSAVYKESELILHVLTSGHRSEDLEEVVEAIKGLRPKY